ncbi:unnamed protein product [Paramecium sonneborni]|uniref:Uncharacterized protein n=1 Tax=Paramecium sonneborni TaxID=65129 RepID=A0A8S1R9V9_9CILI|nr:unnamed protein product [Paramecium sonneborni]
MYRTQRIRLQKMCQQLGFSWRQMLSFTQLYFIRIIFLGRQIHRNQWLGSYQQQSRKINQ